MVEFLKVVAEGYRKKYEDLSFLTFVMPNKRSGTYLLNFFKDLTENPVLAPRIITVSDFIDRCNESVKDSRLDLLFRLFESYNRAQPESGTSFEKFSSWADTMLSDFNEVDMHMVDPDEIFKNVTDLNSIRSTFLTEEQKKVMVEYFGYTPNELLEGTERFWMEFAKKNQPNDDGECISESRKKFYSLWQLLPEIYRDFKNKLKEDGFTTEGGSYKEAALRIESGFEPFRGEKLIFVGFNALAESERRIFKALKKMSLFIEGREEPKADFVWDMISAKIADEGDPAVKFVKINSRKGNFPPPEWLAKDLEYNLPASRPDIEVIAVPSNMMQVKVASGILNDWKKADANMIDSNVAVVLPDEGLLIPLLHSLPEQYQNPNLTMGFPLKQTSVISFASLLRPLHIHSRTTDDGDIFLFEDVKNLLSHPYSHVLFPQDKISKFIERCEDSKRITVGTAALSQLGENSPMLFRHFDESASPLEVISYLKALFNLTYDSLYESNSYLNANIEKAYIVAYNDALARLSNCIGEFNVAISPAGVFSLADRLMAGEKVAFDGQPLRGLQVMGVLETRCLDFERVVMLSVNEKIIPRVGRNSTFIPNVIRAAYGMPPANYQEEIFAYYFFRLIGRCKRAMLTYDSRTSDSRNPGASRYLLQMKYLPEGFSFSETEARFGMPVKEEGEFSVPKDAGISEYLDCYEPTKKESLPPDLKPKNFSSSALGNYMACPLKFLYQNVLELYVDREKIETIDAIDLGTIIHGTIEKLYNPASDKMILSVPIILTKKDLNDILNRKLADGSCYITEVAKREIMKTHFHVPENMIGEDKLRGSAVFLVDYIVEYVKNIIRADIRRAPFRLWGTEIEHTVVYNMPDGRKVKMKMVIDRLDQQGDSDPEQPFRIVDYKTGSVHLSANTFDDIFNDLYEAKNIFQLFLYSELLVQIVKKGGDDLLPIKDVQNFENNLELAIYSVLSLPEDKGILHPKIEKIPIDTLGALREYEATNAVTFKEKLDGLLAEILDRTVPFEARLTPSRCRYCDYRLRCEVLASRQNS